MVALDRDPAAIDATRRNAAANDVSVELALADALREAALPAAEVAVANIALDAVQALGTRLRSLLFVASGYLDAEEPAVAGFRRVARRAASGWAADLFARE